LRTGIKKAATSKTLRVATAFTGVAACAAAFGPTAMAATGQGATYKPDVAATTIEQKEGCPGGTSDWLHLGDGPGNTDMCYGYTGTYTNADWAETSYCGGNNYGWIDVQYPGSTGNTKITFHQGTTYAQIPYAGINDPAIVRSVHISGWSGSDACKPPS
jgi:hypothetical protein